MLKSIFRLRNKHPFLFILLIGLTLRLASAIFSGGYAIADEHFLYVETPYSWLHNIDYDALLTDQQWQSSPQGTSLFYVGINYVIFGFLNFFGISQPSTLMLFMRLINALISLMVISLAYRIAVLISNRKTGYYCALLLAILWFMPYVGVHTLPTAISMPFLLYATLILLKQEMIRDKKLPGYHRSSFFVAGIFLGLGFSIWFQNILFLLGVVAALLIAHNWKGSLIVVAGVVCAVIIAQGIPDLIVWHRPFAELEVFLLDGTQHIQHLLKASWIFHPIPLMLLSLIPPISIMLFYGFFRSYKSSLIISLPVTIFLIYYTLFPSHHCFSMLSVAPLFIVLGLTGWIDYYNSSTFWQRHHSLHKSIWGVAATVNIVLLFFTITLCHHRPEVNAMSYLSRYDKTEYVLIEDRYDNASPMMPLFYGNYNFRYATINNGDALPVDEPDFVLMMGDNDQQQRLQDLKQRYPKLVYETRTNPSIISLLLGWIRPNGDDEAITIYRNENKIPLKR